MERPLSIVIAGFGTVGQGVAELLVHRDDMRVVAIADNRSGNVVARKLTAGLDLRHVLQLAASRSRLAAAGVDCPGDLMSVLDHLDPRGADVLVEATHSNFQTGRPAFDYLNTALERGMHVASTNKGPFACHYRELSVKAAKRGLCLEFEGTVMSGTPVIKLCRDLQAGTAIGGMRGILNGTVNYILSRMMRGRSFEGALSEAQAAGIAEANPSADIEGWDAAAKAAILANVAFNAPLTVHDVARTGIGGLSRGDMDYARKHNQVWKLITHLSRAGGEVECRVAPELLAADDALSLIGDTINAVEIRTSAAGTVTISGPGAGRVQTGFALLSDLLEIKKRVGNGCAGVRATAGSSA